MKSFHRGCIALALWVFAGAASAESTEPVAEVRGLTGPQGVASDPQAVPVIASGDGHILQLLDRDTAVVLADTKGRPTGLAFDKLGYLYAADSQRGAVLRISPTGETTIVASQCLGVPFVSPARLAVGPDGVLYVTDTAASRICRIDSQGRTSLFALNVRGPSAIAFASDHMLIGDSAGRIWKYEMDGKTNALFAALDGPGDLSGMALDEQGNVYVARNGAGIVTVLNPQGKLIASYAVGGPRVTDVAFGGGDLKTLYVTEASTGSVYKLRVPYRGQRMPWEVSEALRIVEPVDGAILNRHDGETIEGGLRIMVRGVCGTVGPVRVDGKEVPVHDGRFETAVVLKETSSRIRVEADGMSRQITVFALRDALPSYRFSTDDNILFLKDIAQHASTYRSIFENPYLAFWRQMHQRYGTKIHFNIYYETDGFNLSQMPARFRPEWEANADWIRLSFHARANDPDRPYLHASASQIRDDYRRVNREIVRFAGEKVLSPFTTVHWGATTLEAARALRAEGVRGLVGYFKEVGDSPQVSYYLPREQWNYLSGRDYWKDMREGIVFVRHDIVINLFPVDQIVPVLEKIAADPHQGEVIEMMIHEQYFYPDYINYEPDYRERVEAAIRWAHDKKYRPVFFEELLGSVLDPVSPRQ